MKQVSFQMNGYESREREIYKAYLDEIVPLIAAIEVYDNEFPAEVLNEVRSIFTHFARCKLAASEDEVADNVQKAERHLKRLRFDCNKYVTMMRATKIAEIMDAYSHKALAGVNDGAFLIDVNKLMSEADSAAIMAKKLEAAGDERAALEQYARSASSYAEIEELIKDSRDAIGHAQALYGAFEEDVAKSGKRGFIVGVVGVAVGVIGIAVGVTGILL